VRDNVAPFLLRFAVGNVPVELLLCRSGCEYGDRAQWCETFADLDCSDDHQRHQCCLTCAQRTEPPSSGSGGSGSCPLGDGASFCSTMAPMDCYYYSDLCCETCPTHHTGVEGIQSRHGNWSPFV